MIKRISKTSWYALLLGLVFALEITNFIVYLIYSTIHIWLSYLEGVPANNVIISDLNDAADKARVEVEYYSDMMIHSWLGKLMWDDEQGIFVREFQSKKKEAMKKDDKDDIDIDSMMIGF